MGPQNILIEIANGILSTKKATKTTNKLTDESTKTLTLTHKNGFAH
jgi:hypothetical protein